MERVVRFRGSLSVILFSLDGRADISAEMGEDIAEKLMTDFISVVKSRIRSMDFLARLEENEFVVLTSMSGYLAQQMADKIRDTVCHHKFLPGRGVTCSLGACEYRKEISSGEMVKRASLVTERREEGGRKQGSPGAFDLNREIGASPEDVLRTLPGMLYLFRTDSIRKEGKRTAVRCAKTMIYDAIIVGSACRNFCRYGACPP